MDLDKFLNGLKAKADAASSGPWLFRAKSSSVHQPSGTHPFGKRIFAFREDDGLAAEIGDVDLAHILAFYPQVVTALVNVAKAVADHVADFPGENDDPWGVREALDRLSKIAET